MSSNEPTIPANTVGLRYYATAVYVLQLITFPLLPAFLIAAVLILWKRKAAQGTWVESHFHWQLNTFLYGSGGLLLGGLTFATPAGLPILIATALWIAFRVVQGWVRLSKGQEIRRAQGAS